MSKDIHMLFLSPLTSIHVKKKQGTLLSDLPSCSAAAVPNLHLTCGLLMTNEPFYIFLIRLSQSPVHRILYDQRA
jgi:hypothetical protein